MSKSQEKKKIPGNPFTAKDKHPREAPDNANDHQIVWSFQILDMGGRWCWSASESIEEIIETVQKLGELEKLNETDRGRRGCHSIEVTDVTHEARERLRIINQDDAEVLYSFRIDGKGRIWGIRKLNMIKILWWDPNHEICPSLLKHT